MWEGRQAFLCLVRQSTGGLSKAPPLPPVAAYRPGSHWTFPCEDCVRQVLGRGAPDATLRSHSDLEAPGLLGFGVLPPTFHGVNFVQLKRNKVAFSWKKEKKKHPPLLIYCRGTLERGDGAFVCICLLCAGMRRVRCNCKIKTEIL